MFVDFSLNSCELFKYPSGTGGKGVLARHIPGGVYRSEVFSRLLWPYTADAIIGTTDGWYRRHLVASVFGLRGWAADLPEGPVVFDVSLYSNKDMLRKLLPPCELDTGTDSENCPFRAENRDFSKAGRRITTTYLKGLKHILTASCQGRSIAAMRNAVSVGYGRTKGYKFVDHPKVMAGGVGNSGILGWMRSTMKDVYLHGVDEDWSISLATVGCCSRLKEKFWSGFLYTFQELMSPLHERPESIRDAFIENEMSDFVFRGATSEDLAAFIGRFTSSFGRRKIDWESVLECSASGCAIKEPLLETNRIIFGNFAYANGFEGMCDTVLIGPEVMPKASYDSTRENGSCHVSCNYSAVSISSGEKADVRYSYNYITRSWEFDGTDEESKNMSFHPNGYEKWEDVGDSITETSRVFVLAMNAPRNVPGSASVMVNSPSGIKITIGKEIVENILARIGTKDSGWLYIIPTAISTDDSAMTISYCFGESGTWDATSIDLTESPITTTLIAQVSMRADISRVTSRQKDMQYKDLDWPSKPSPGLYPHIMFSDGNRPGPTHFCPTFLLSYRVYNTSKSENVAGEGALVDDTEASDKKWKLWGKQCGPFFAGNRPDFALSAWDEMEGVAKSMAISSVGGYDFIDHSFSDTILNSLSTEDCIGKGSWMAKEATKNSTLKMGFEPHQKFRVFVESGSPDYIYTEEAVYSAGKWSAWERVPTPLYVQIGVSVNAPSTTIMPPELIRYSDVTADAASFGIAAVEWGIGRMDPTADIDD